jgi:hypothetical protein
VAASCRTGRKDRTQLTDATLSRRPVAKTGAAFPSVRKSFQGARHTSARKQHTFMAAGNRGNDDGPLISSR